MSSKLVVLSRKILKCTSASWVERCLKSERSSKNPVNKLSIFSILALASSINLYLPSSSLIFLEN